MRTLARYSGATMGGRHRRSRDAGREGRANRERKADQKRVRDEALRETAKDFLDRGAAARDWYLTHLATWHDHVRGAGELGRTLATSLRNGTMKPPPIDVDEAGVEWAHAEHVAEEKARILVSLDASVDLAAQVEERLKSLIEWAEALPGRGRPKKLVEAMLVDAVRRSPDLAGYPAGHLKQIDVSTGEVTLVPHAAQAAEAPPSLSAIQDAVDHVTGVIREPGSLAKSMRRKTRTK